MKLESPKCIICENDRFLDYLTVDDGSGSNFSLKKCQCSLVLTSPRPCEISIDDYYLEGYMPHSKTSANISLFNKISRIISYSWKRKIIKNAFVNKKITMLDVGGGDGALALYLKDKLSLINVYEKNSNCISHITQNNIFSSDNLEDFKDSNYNIITLFHSLEHVHNIEDLFYHINRVSKKDAKMIIAVPNINASEIKFLTNKWVAWDVPRHLYHFSPKTLAALLDKYGWKIIQSKSMLQDTLFNIYMSLEGSFIKKTFLFILLLGYSLISQFLFSNKQSTNLVICQKK